MCRNPLQNIGGSVGQSRIVVPEQFNQSRRPPRLGGDKSGDLRNPPEGQRMPPDGKLGAKIDVARHKDHSHPLSYGVAAGDSDLAAIRPTPRSNAFSSHRPSASGKKISPVRFASGR